jgi:hypothetical protein
VSLAKQIESEIGPATKASTGGGPRNPSDVFGLANKVDTRSVLDWMGVEHDDKFAKCPGCQEDGALICENGGVKCLHDRCKAAGVPSMDGFRTNVDVVQLLCGGTALDAAKATCKQFGIAIPEKEKPKQTKAKAQVAPPDPEQYQREPGDDEFDPDPQAEPPKPVDEARVYTVRELLEQSGLRALKRERVRSCTTGHWLLDYATGGFKPGFVWLMGADTSYGKSSWLVMVADENIRAGKKVLIVSGEDSESLYGDRLLVRRSGVDYGRFGKGKLTREEEQKVTMTMARGEDVPVFLDARGWSIEKVCRHLPGIIDKHNIDLVALDYVQAFDNEKPQQDKRNQVTYIGRKFTDTVKESGKAGLMLSQITKNDQKKNPDKHSIRDSRDLSHAAEVILLGFEPDKAITRSNGGMLADAGQKCMLLDKCKDGPRGGIYPMQWNTVSACFDTIKDPDAQRIDEMIGDDYDQFDARYP